MSVLKNQCEAARETNNNSTTLTWPVKFKNIGKLHDKELTVPQLEKGNSNFCAGF